MQQYAQQNAAAAGLEPNQLRLLLGDAEQLPFEDGSFDAAAITLVSLSICCIQPSLGLPHAHAAAGPQPLAPKGDMMFMFSDSHCIALAGILPAG
jgi:hypothetical protein